MKKNKIVKIKIFYKLTIFKMKFKHLEILEIGQIKQMISK